MTVNGAHPLAAIRNALRKTRGLRPNARAIEDHAPTAHAWTTLPSLPPRESPHAPAVWIGDHELREHGLDEAAVRGALGGP
jgi:hypothetical protein